MTSVSSEATGSLSVSSLSNDAYRNSSPTQHTAVLSLSEPYKFQSISQNFCNLFDFAPEQLLGRSVKILQGPNTNAAAFGAAIKSALLQQRCTVPLTICRSDGSECEVEITCSAHSVEDGVLDGVSLTFSPRGNYSPTTKSSVGKTRVTKSFLVLDSASAGNSTESPAPFSLAARNLRGSARAKYRTIAPSAAIWPCQGSTADIEASAA